MAVVEWESCGGYDAQEKEAVEKKKVATRSLVVLVICKYLSCIYVSVCTLLRLKEAAKRREGERRRASR